ncbi:hypothetical protein GCM10027567_20630 [Spongiibacter taiwanensis]
MNNLVEYRPCGGVISKGHSINPDLKVNKQQGWRVRSNQPSAARPSAWTGSFWSNASQANLIQINRILAWQEMTG